MAKTYSISAGHFIDANARSGESAQVAEIAANMAVSDALSAMTSALVAFCPHKDVCRFEDSLLGCRRKTCPYLQKYYSHMRDGGTLFLPE